MTTPKGLFPIKQKKRGVKNALTQMVSLRIAKTNEQFFMVN